MQENNSHPHHTSQQQNPSSMVTNSDELNHNLAYQKLVNGLTHYLTTLTSHKPPELLLLKINYLHYLATLKHLNMIHDNYHPSNNDHVSQLWQEIQHTSIGHFIITITAILKLYPHPTLNQKYTSLRLTRLELQGKIKTLEP